VEPSILDAFSTPVFRAKQAIVQKVFGLRPEMYAAILAGNPGMPRILDSYEKNLSHLKKLILRGDASGLAALLKKP
jgi:prephenate dehydrogenase